MQWRRLLEIHLLETLRSGNAETLLSQQTIPGKDELIVMDVHVRILLSIVKD